MEAKKKYDIAFYEAFDEEQRIIKELLKDEKFSCFYTDKTIQDVKDPVTSDIVSVRTQSLLPTEYGEYISAIITRSAGYDHIKEFDLRTKKYGRKIAYCHLPDYCKRSVAEQAIISMGILLRKMKLQMKNFGRFFRDGMTGSEIQGRKISILGVGKIGGECVKLAVGLNMQVKCVDLLPNESLARKYNVSYYPLKTALKDAEVVISCLPLTELTKGLLSYGMLKSVARGRCVFINVGRGEVSPTSELLKLLNEGILSGVALDVYDGEKPLAGVLRGELEVAELPEGKDKESVVATLKMMEMDNVLLTPHNAFNTHEAVERKCKFSVENFLEFRKSGKFFTPVPILKK